MLHSGSDFRAKGLGQPDTVPACRLGPIKGLVGRFKYGFGGWTFVGPVGKSNTYRQFDNYARCCLPDIGTRLLPGFAKLELRSRDGLAEGLHHWKHFRRRPPPKEDGKFLPPMTENAPATPDVGKPAGDHFQYLVADIVTIGVIEVLEKIH